MHLQRRGGVYQWRRRVPLQVAERWGRAEVSRSLRTASASLVAWPCHAIQ
jgi:hypothetical protein